jgi:hypothetical protein
LIGKAVGVGVEDHLPGIAALSNMMRNVDDYDPRQTSHSDKVSDGGRPFDRGEVISRSEFPN